MRYSIALAAFVALLASGGRHAALAQTPERLVRDSGTPVRVRPDGKSSIEGYLLVTFTASPLAMRIGRIVACGRGAN
jgi:hypothetical protein